MLADKELINYTVLTHVSPHPIPNKSMTSHHLLGIKWSLQVHTESVMAQPFFSRESKNQSIFYVAAHSTPAAQLTNRTWQLIALQVIFVHEKQCTGTRFVNVSIRLHYFWNLLFIGHLCVVLTGTLRKIYFCSFVLQIVLYCQHNDEMNNGTQNNFFYKKIIIIILERERDSDIDRYLYLYRYLSI